MRLKYKFEIVDMGDNFVAVPVGDNADQFRAAVDLNDVGAKILEIIAECDTPEEVHKKLCAEYPEDDANDIGQKLCDFLNQLVREGMLEP